MTTTHSQQHSLVLGLGISGQSCVRHLYASDRLTVVDSRASVPGYDEFAAQYPDVDFRLGSLQVELGDVDRLIVSPGLPMDNCLVRQAVSAGLPVVGDIDLFCAAVVAPVYAITGTNGKSTVTTLVAQLLSAAGTKAVAGGNLGTAALDLLDQSSGAAAYVLELSSFQLERMQSWNFAAGCILNVSEDHIDHHGNMAAYVESKRAIYRDVALAVYNRQDELTTPAAGIDHVSFGSDEPAAGQYGVCLHAGERWLCRGKMRLLPCTDLNLSGTHNEQNALAALAMLDKLLFVGRQVNNPDQLAAVMNELRSFGGLAHRCELVCTKGGVRYINDSKATNVGATIAALQGLGTPGEPNLVLLLGGDSKGADLKELVAPVSASCACVVAYGACQAELTQLLQGQVPFVGASNFTAAVTTAHGRAVSGQIVLLSPACASFDMFTNFVERGESFVRLVTELTQESRA